MSINYNLAPIPKWVLLNNEGTSSGGAKLYTYRSLNKVQQKPVYKDSGGSEAWTNPIIFDANGVQGPFYWKVDSSNLTDTYYLEAYDSDNNLLWTVDDYFPSGTGGGGTVTTYIDVKNYIANNQFIDHIDDIAVAANLTNTLIAPSNHKGFTPSLLNPVTSTYGVVGSDIRFVKNNTGLLSDQITFPLFVLGIDALNGDCTPVDYVKYQCSGSPAGETYKAFQFPITQKVQNLSGQTVTFNMYAAVAATPATIIVSAIQYFGSGTAASATVRTPLGAPVVLSTSWTKINIVDVIPSVTGKSIGTPGLQTDDDALYIHVEMPLGSNCEIYFTKPALYLGNVNPDVDFDDYDQINSVNSTPRTGDIRTSLSSSAPKGWVAMNDGSIGNSGSGATNRPNKDTFQLYKTIWDGVNNQTWAPVSSGSYGASAISDFLAGYTLTLPKSLGRAMAGAGAGAGLTSRALGEYVSNAESITLSANNLPAHTHPPLTTNNFLSNLGGVGQFSAGGTAQLTTNATTGNNVTTNDPFSIMQPSSFMNVFIKL